MQLKIWHTFFLDAESSYMLCYVSSMYKTQDRELLYSVHQQPPGNYGNVEIISATEIPMKN